MKRLATIAALAALLGGAAGSSLAGTIEPNLQAVLATAGDQETVSALVYLADRVDVDALTQQLDQQKATRKVRHEVVVTSLQERAAATQGNLLAELKALEAQGQVSRFRAFWIANCIRVDATPAAIKAIAARADVEAAYLNYPIELIEPVAQGSGGGPPGEDRNPVPEVGIIAVRAPEVWELGFTGDGILVATLDTGVEGTHPALASRWRGVADPRYEGHPEWAWFDPVTNTTFPQSFGAHGTHTMGTVCGGPPGDEIGVAPGAQWIHAGVIDRVSLEQTVADAIAAFQWMVDPDEDPTTSWDVPQVCSNSWGIGSWHNIPPYNFPCDESFWGYLDACEAAGTVILFSAGNEGPGPDTLRRPADRATDEYRTFAVGAVNANVPSWPIADFSSRGPSYCTPTGGAAIKPECVAPGVDVRSSVPGGGYEQYGWSGTSMASPHVNGAVALIREACPDLTVEEVKQIIIETAHDLGSAGNDNTYGYGMVDCYEAVQLALSLCSGAPRARDGYYETPVDVPALVTLEATDYDGLPDPPGALVYRIVALPSEPGNTLTDVGNDHVILPEELPYELVDGGNEVLFSPAEGYYGYQTFQFLANDGGEPPDAGDSNIATITVLVLFDPPVITTESLPDGILAVPYGPVQLEATGGQPELVWEVLPAGQYYETDLGSSLFSEVGSPRGWHADDQAWSYTLPFTFPFFGAEYTSCYICSNGFINFGSSSSEYSNSDSGLIGATRIAPLWDDLTSYSPDDMYIDESVPGQVTIRWDVSTIWTGYPCNFSATLFEDGRIQFHYGSGNNGITPTIGISAGDGEHYLLASYNNAGSLTNANSLEFVAPLTLPEGLVLSPEGEFSGAPMELGVFSPTIRVTDSLGRTDQRQFTFEVVMGPPVAEDQEVSTPANTPLTITLLAEDNGLPDPPGALIYIIDSLPINGTLTDTGAGVIDTVPYTLVDGGNQVIYTPDWWYVGGDSFTFKADDGGEPPTGGDSNVATISIDVLLPEPELIYDFPLDSDPGWTTEAQWAFGQPTGGGSHDRDPTSGHTGSNVYGYDLGIDDEGDYESSMPARYLTATATDCGVLLGVELRFWRWLAVESSNFDHATVEVSNDGANWTEVWANPVEDTSDTSWSQMALDISALADREPTVYVRWAMGPTDESVTYPGWNIDDVEIWGVVTGPRCPGDVDGDGDVDLTDLSILLSNYGMTSGAQYEDGDMDGDGDVDLTDLALLLAHYGETCP